MTSSPVAGINGKLQVDSLVAYGVRLDTIRFNVASTDDKITYSGQIRNGKNNPQYVFNALFGGEMTERGTSLTARLYDIARFGKGKTAGRRWYGYYVEER